MKPWKPLDAVLLLSAPPWLNVYQESVELPSGRILNDFYRVVLPDFAVIVAVTPNKELVMVRSYKHGLRKISLSAPAGLVETGELPLQTAQRELLEETGYAATEWRSMGRFIVDGNRQCGTAHIFLAENALPVAVGREDEAEEVQVELLSPNKFLQAIQQGDVATLTTVSAVALVMVSGLGR
ncbi:MAG: NUDIX hydrolase [Acidobacteria bacterium]|nr:NUDIX hydrolase [Acidobacteriota bacterium]MBI3655118.1 NUDIX hydrolase [Acidobacteriota bacterium]